MNNSAWIALASAATVLMACGANEPQREGGDPMALIRAGDAKACAHPEVLDSLLELISTPRGDEQLFIPIDAAARSKLTLPEVKIDKITIAAYDESVSRVTCIGVSIMEEDIGGPSSKFEKEITYNISPSAQSDNEFVVSTSDSIAADRINLALVKEIARGVRQAENDNATAERLQAALQNAGPAEAGATPSPPETNGGTEAGGLDYSASYSRCMESGEAAEGVTAAMAACNNEELAKQDARLNAAYQTAMAARTQAQKASLREAQRAWIKLRDTKCREDLSGGTMDILIEGGCILDMTAKRADELAAMANS